jgi:flavin reductase (DIM6/NTAB) family NADH-FMN oxidoreductase RutF
MADSPPISPSSTEQAFALLPSAVFLMSAAFEGKRVGVLVGSVQACDLTPPLLCVAMRKGQGIEPMIRDARTFAINIIDPKDKLVLRKFSDPNRSREIGDPFDGMPVEKLATGAPILKKSLAAFDCEVIRHIDIAADHELYIGQVLASKVYGGVRDPA